MKWIDVNEELPKKKRKTQLRESVLVTLRNGVVKEMEYEFKTKEFWETGDINHLEHWQEDNNDDGFNVIAWMYLPEPYKRN